MNPDRSYGTLVMALVAIGLLVGAYLAPWFVYEFSSGRQTPPDGPQPEDETGIVTHWLTFHADGWEGDIDPSDEALAQASVFVTPVLLVLSGALMLAVVFGEIPGPDRMVGRTASLAFLAAALLSTIMLAVIPSLLMPGSMAGHGVTGAYTARLDEPIGYTRAYMHTAWYLCMLSSAAVFVAGLFKFQAGPLAGDVLREHLAKS